MFIWFALVATFFQNPQSVDRYVEVNGLRLHYLDWGTEGKQPLIMLHGIGRSAHTFDHIASRFAGKYHVIAVDMRGHGQSAWDPKGAYLVEDYTKDIEALADQLRLRNIVIWGNSTGGRVAQVFAGLHPELVAAVISEDVGPERPREIADGFATRVRRGGATDFDPAIANGFVPTELWRFVKQIKAPIIYVLGGKSTIVPASTQEELKKTLPQAQIETIPNTGHYPSEENATAFLAIVDKFLAAK